MTSLTSTAPSRISRIRGALSGREWASIGGMLGFVTLLHIVGWGVLVATVTQQVRHVGSAEVFSIGLGVTAYMLGLRHAFDADHIAAIDNTTRKMMGNGTRPLSVGFWFSLGHSSIVFGTQPVMRAHARVRVELAPSGDGTTPTRVQRLHSEGALVLRPTRESLPEWTNRWNIAPGEAAALRVAAGAAGPIGGDEWQLDVEVGAGATLMLGTVSATLALPGPHGKASRSDVNVSVDEGGTLMWLPGAQIAAADCRHVAIHRIELAEGARLYAREEVVLGRHGESPGNFRQRLRVTRGNATLYDQELAVGPEAIGWNSSAVIGGRRALGSILIVDTVQENLDCFPATVSTDFPDTVIMRLAHNAVLITSLAADTIELRHRLDAALARFALPG